MLKGIKGFFVEMEDEAPAKKELPVQRTEVLSVVMSSPYSPVNGKIKENLAAELKTKLTGTPYLMFQTISGGMKATLADPATRTLATIASLTAQGTPKLAVIESADKALAFLHAEGAAFQAEMDGSLIKLTESHTKKIEETVSQMNEKQEQIRKLGEEIAALSTSKIELEMKFSQDKSTIEQNKIEFQGALNSLAQEINTDIADITRHGV